MYTNASLQKQTGEVPVRGSSSQDVLWDVAEASQWVWKQKGISLNKDAVTAQLHRNNVQSCIKQSHVIYDS